MHYRPNRVKYLRQQRGLSAREVAKLAAISPTTMVEIEKHQALPGLEVRARVASVLGVSETTVWPPEGGVAELATDLEPELAELVMSVALLLADAWGKKQAAKVEAAA